MTGIGCKADSNFLLPRS